MPLNLLSHDSETFEKRGSLYIVATPIGNMDDITLRAIKILEMVDIVAAEDTRHTGKLLSCHKIKAILTSYHKHNEQKQTSRLIEKLKEGLSVALVSNAGTPSLSDPGYSLVKKAIENSIRIIPIPGASALITALCAAGLPTDSFLFVGFPPKKKGKRHKQLTRLADNPETIIFYESPKRLTRLLEEIIMIMGNRYGVLAREMTKLYEEFIRGSMTDILCSLNRRDAVKGESVLLVKGCANKETDFSEVIRDEIIRGLEMQDVGISELSRQVAEKYGISRKKVYEEGLKLKRKQRDLRGSVLK